MSAAPGVGCGAWIEEDGRVLLVHRLRAPELGCWNLPGGKVDAGERAAEAVAREISEELDIGIAVGPLLCLSELIGEDHHWVSPVYCATIVAGDPVNREPEKHAAVRWWPLDALPSPLGQAVMDGLAALSRPEHLPA
ncbi:NUDIX domain-containing protein [Alsobacter sp. R-9]